MTDEIKLDRRESWRVADGMAQASARVLEYRVNNLGRLSEDEELELEKLEDELDHLVVLLRSRGVTLLGAEAAEAASGLQQAIVKGQEVLEGIQDVRNVIRAATGLVELAVAILGRNAGGTLAALQDLYAVAAEYEGLDDSQGQV